MRVCALWRAIIWETLLWWQKLRKHLTVLFESLETRRKHATQPKECVNVILHLSSAVSLASWLRESPIGSCESGTAKPSAKHFWQSCRLSWPSLNPRSRRSLNTRRRRSQFVDQPPNPFISVGVLVPHHLNVYCLWCVGQIQQYEGKMRSAQKCESAR